MSNNEKYFLRILNSFKLNYKTWIALLLSCIVMFWKSSIFIAWIEYLLCIMYAYLAHRLAHEPIGFFVNRAHIYHHEHTDWTSHAIQVCVELAASYSPIVLLYYILDLPNKIFPFDPYIFMLFSIFYTSTHNINYGMLHVNDVHYKHHLDYSVNYGPDICDIIFNTKYPVDEIENTDHYIPNIVIATVATYLFRTYYEKSSNKQEIKDILFKLYLVICFIVSIFTAKKTLMDIQNIIDTEREEFNNNIEYIFKKLKNK